MNTMMQLRYDPYKNFTTSATPVGLYARQKWLGQEGGKDWQFTFGNTVGRQTTGEGLSATCPNTEFQWYLG